MAPFLDPLLRSTLSSIILRLLATINRQDYSKNRFRARALEWEPDKGCAARKLVRMTEHGMVLASAASSKALGYSGYMKLWDPRSRKRVWETSKPGAGRSSRFADLFAGVDVDKEMKIYKVCWKSGDLTVADVRKLRDMRSTEGGGDSMVHCYKKQVFVSQDSGLEVWSEVEEAGKGDRMSEEKTYGRNLLIWKRMQYQSQLNCVFVFNIS